MTFASKSTLGLNDLKILWSKVTKNLKNLPKKFCESPPWSFNTPISAKRAFPLNVAAIENFTFKALQAFVSFQHVS